MRVKEIAINATHIMILSIFSYLVLMNPPSS